MAITVTTFLGISRAFANNTDFRNTNAFIKTIDLSRMFTTTGLGGFVVKHTDSIGEHDEHINLPEVGLQIYCTNSDTTCKYDTASATIYLPDYPYCPIKVTYGYKTCKGEKFIDAYNIKIIYQYNDKNILHPCAGLKKVIDSMVRRGTRPASPTQPADTGYLDFFRELRDSVFMQLAKYDFTRSVLRGGGRTKDYYKCGSGMGKRTYINVQGTCMKVVYIPEEEVVDSNYTPVMDSNGFVYSGSIAGAVGAAGGIGTFPWGSFSGEVTTNNTIDTSSKGKIIRYYSCGEIKCCNVYYYMCYDTTKLDSIGVETVNLLDTNQRLCSKYNASPPRKHYKGELEFPCGKYCKQTTTHPTSTRGSGSGISSNSCNCHKEQNKEANNDKQFNTKAGNIKEAKETTRKYNR